MQWKCYEKIIYGNICSGEDNKDLRLQYKETTVNKFLEYLLPRLEKFVVHNFVARFKKSSTKPAWKPLLKIQ